MLAGALVTGKLCTAVLFVSLTVLVLMPGLKQEIIRITTIVDAVVMLIFFGHYALTYYKKPHDPTHRGP